MEKLILNPNAGQGKGIILKPIIKRFLNLKEKEIFVSKNIYEIKEKIRELLKNNTDKIIVGCGDGGFNAAINTVIEEKKETITKIGFIPLGMSNICALSAGIPLNIFKVLKIIKMEKTKKFPVLEIKKENKTQFAFNSIDFGYTSCVSYNAEKSRLLKKLFGKINHILWGIYFIFFKHLPEIEIKINGSAYRTHLVIIFNGPFFGGRFKIGNIKTEDMMFELLYLKTKNRFLFFINIFKIMLGIKDYKIIEPKKGKHVKIKSDIPLPLQIDGEPFFTAKEFEVYLSEKYINLIC